MKFEDALAAMRAGIIVTRPVYQDYKKLRLIFIPCLVDEDGDEALLNNRDILAEDWEEVHAV